MENALDKALANASLNAKMNGDTLHTENLDSIADPSFDKPDPDYTPYAVTPKPPEYDPRTVAFNSDYQLRMEEECKRKQEVGLATRHEDVIRSIRASLLQLEHKIDHIVLSNKPEPINLRLDALADMITEMHSTIQNAKQSMPETPNHKHRSLHEWDDTQLLNELVERENDLMPFYYELLKRIGSPELQKLVMSSMQGKNNSMVTLAQLCSALAPQPQPQYPHMSEAQRTELKPRSGADRVVHEQSQYVPTTIPQQQYFGQLAEEYVKSLYTDKPVQNRIG